MSNEVDTLITDVAAEDAVIDAAVVAFQGLAAQIADVAGDKEKTLALSEDVKAKATELAAAIPQNTPVTPAQAKQRKGGGR